MCKYIIIGTQEESHRDFVLHFRTTSFDNSSTNPAIPTISSASSVDDDEDDEGLVYTTSTEFILNPVVTRDKLTLSSSNSEDEQSLPEVTITVENHISIGLGTPGMDHSRDMLISSEDKQDEEEEMTGM